MSSSHLQRSQKGCFPPNSESKKKRRRPYFFNGMLPSVLGNAWIVKATEDEVITWINGWKVKAYLLGVCPDSRYAKCLSMTQSRGRESGYGKEAIS